MKDMRKKQGLSSLLYFKYCTSSWRHIREFFTSAKVNRGFEINQQIVYPMCMWSLGHGNVGTEKFDTLMNIPKPLTVRTITKQFQK